MFPLSDFLLPGFLPLNRLNIVVLIFIRAFEKNTIVKKLEFSVLAISQKKLKGDGWDWNQTDGKSNAFSFQIFSRKGITTPSVKRQASVAASPMQVYGDTSLDAPNGPRSIA